ncbi:hypothetical protein IKF86_00670 [Candidatus Saccharibacteria bacterium]|nr:hypothetical protein [Candidatus Saccharibacteria bacterium]
MRIQLQKRLNIFADETGEFGFTKGSARFYGVSFVFHEQDDSISKYVNELNVRLGLLDFYSMVHMGDLVSGHEDFAGMDIAERRRIYTQLYRFSTKVPAKYHSVIIDKKAFNDDTLLSEAIERELQKFVLDHLAYLQQFDEIKVYYDGGQKQLGKIIDEVFSKLSGYHRESNFDHLEKKLFQVADMLTYTDKLIYKYNKNIKFSNTEKGFFDVKTIIRIKRELKKHRFEQNNGH